MCVSIERVVGVGERVVEQHLRVGIRPQQQLVDRFVRARGELEGGRIEQLEHFCEFLYAPSEDARAGVCLWSGPCSCTYAEVTNSFFPRPIDTCRRLRKAPSHKPVDTMG